MKFHCCASVCTSQNWFPFSNFSLPQPNVTKLIYNVYNHKTQIKVEFLGCHIYNSRVNCHFTNGKNADFFCFHSSTLVCLRLMLWNFSRMCMTTKHRSNFNFWWCHFYHSRVMPLYQWKNCWIFCFLSLTWDCLSWLL